MKTSFAIKNISASILVEIVTAIAGILLPRFFIEVYGSSVNGLVASISQFITYMGLVEAGVGAAATFELYKPITGNDEFTINGILSAAKNFYLKSGTLFLILDLILVLGYPYLVNNEISDIAFIRLMIIVLSLNGVIDYFILGKYKVLLIADQRTYVIAIAQAVGIVITLITSILLIEMRVSPILVKAVVAIVYLLRTFVIVLYSRKRYPYINFKTEYPESVFSQRKSALFHQVVGMICNNTDIVLLTTMLKGTALIEVSVYATFNMVAYTITSLFNSISNGIRASFGQVIAEKREDTLRMSFSNFELAYFILLYIVYTCMAVLLHPFINLYASVFTDSATYIRWDLVFLFTLCGLIQNIRIPSSTIQIAAGHFKETQGAAFLEATINLGISLLLVRQMGINGVLIGTICAYLYRSTYQIIYCNNHFLNNTILRTLKRVVINSAVLVGLTFAGIKFAEAHINTWLQWIFYAICMVVVFSIVYLLVNYASEPQTMRDATKHIISTITRKKKSINQTT